MSGVAATAMVPDTVHSRVIVREGYRDGYRGVGSGIATGIARAACDRAS